MPRSPKPLYDLLLALFRSNDDLFELLANYDYRQAANLVAALPGPNVSRSTYSMQAVQQLQAHGLDNGQLFASLAERFPGRSDLIEATKRTYLGERQGAGDQSDDVKTIASLGPAPTTDLTSA